MLGALKFTSKLNKLRICIIPLTIFNTDLFVHYGIHNLPDSIYVFSSAKDCSRKFHQSSNVSHSYLIIVYRGWAELGFAARGKLVTVFNPDP